MGEIKSPRLVQALREQFNYERLSADIYYGLAVQLDTLNLTGSAAYMQKRAGEERDHALKFSNYLADRNTLPALIALPDPMRAVPTDVFKAPRTAFELALAHERTVTARINMLSDLALEENDPTTGEFLLWFIHEQVEEERSLEEVLTRLTLAEGNGAALLLLEHELGGVA